MVRLVALLASLMLLVTACGGDEPEDAAAPADEATEDAGAATDDDSGATEDAAEPTDGATEDVAAGDEGGDCTLDEPVPVGVVFSQTAGAAVYGVSQTAAVELAAEELNAEGGVTYDLIIEDDATDPAQGITAYERLIEQEQVSILVGPTLSNVFFSAGPVAQEFGVPALGVSTTADGITEIGDYIFRDSLTEAQVIPNTVAEATENLGLERVALLYSDNDAFTVSGFEIFEQAVEEQGLEVTSTETFATGDTDFSAQLTAVANNEPDALFVSALAEEAALLLTQARDLGLDVPVVGGNGFNSPAIIDQAGEAAEGVIVGAAWNAAADDEANEAFKSAYEEATGRAPDQFAAQAYTGMKLIARAVESACSADRDAIRDAMEGLQGVDTILGEFSFTDGRDADHTGVTQVVEDGSFALLD